MSQYLVALSDHRNDRLLMKDLTQLAVEYLCVDTDGIYGRQHVKNVSENSNS